MIQWQFGLLSRAASSAVVVMSTYSFAYELGYSYQEFFRVLPSAIDNQPYIYQDRTIHFDYQSGSICIELSDERLRSIGSIRLPYINVTFRFHNVDERQRQIFIARFDLYFHRGGG